MSDALAAQREREWSEICGRVTERLRPVEVLPTMVPVAVLSGDTR